MEASEIGPGKSSLAATQTQWGVDCFRFLCRPTVDVCLVSVAVSVSPSLPAAPSHCLERVRAHALSHARTHTRSRADTKAHAYTQTHANKNTFNIHRHKHPHTRHRALSPSIDLAARSLSSTHACTETDLSFSHFLLQGQLVHVLCWILSFARNSRVVHAALVPFQSLSAAQAAEEAACFVRNGGQGSKEICIKLILFDFVPCEEFSFSILFFSCSWAGKTCLEGSEERSASWLSSPALGREGLEEEDISTVLWNPIPSHVVRVVDCADVGSAGSHDFWGRFSVVPSPLLPGAVILR